MPVFKTFEHIEKWVMYIVPGEGETWPVCSYRMNPRAIMIHPDMIWAEIQQGGEIHGYAEGSRVRANGTPGKIRDRIRFYSYEETPEWVQEIIKHELHARGLYGKVCVFNDAQ
jgi:hypothetical protein